MARGLPALHLRRGVPAASALGGGLVAHAVRPRPGNARDLADSLLRPRARSASSVGSTQSRTSRIMWIVWPGSASLGTTKEVLAADGRVMSTMPGRGARLAIVPPLVHELARARRARPRPAGRLPLGRRGKGRRRRQLGMDEWAGNNCAPRSPPAPSCPLAAVLHHRRPHPRKTVVGSRSVHRVPAARRPSRAAERARPARAARTDRMLPEPGPGGRRPPMLIDRRTRRRRVGARAGLWTWGSVARRDTPCRAANYSVMR
jgi:hypothetical protein